MFGTLNRRTAYGEASLEAEVLSASQHKLTLMLFNAAIDAMKKMVIAIETKHLAEKSRVVVKAIDILENGLKASIDREAGDAELGDRLYYLYDYIQQRLLFAHLHNNAAEIGELIDMLSGIRDAWREIDPEKNSDTIARVSDWQDLSASDAGSAPQEAAPDAS